MSYSRKELATLGKRASDLHRMQGVELTNAVVKVASSERGLTDEHITRITENANLITFEEKFKASDSKHVVFDLADPTEVISNMQEQVPSSSVSNAYDFAPSYEPVEDVFDQFSEKTSSFNINPAYQDQQLLIKVSHACKQLESDLYQIDSEAERAMYALTEMVKKAALQHGTMYGPLQVIGAVADSPEIFEKVATVAVQMSPNIPPGEYIDQLPNYNHPLAAQYLRVEDLTKQAELYRSGYANIIAERDRLMSLNTVMGDL